MEVCSLARVFVAAQNVVIDQRTLAAPAGVGSVSSNGLLAANDVRIFSQGDVNVDTVSFAKRDVSVASTSQMDRANR